MKPILYMCAILTLAGCTTNHYIAAKHNRPGKIMAKAYTHDGCLSALKERAEELGVEVETERVSSGLIRYKCYGKVAQ